MAALGPQHQGRRLALGAPALPGGNSGRGGRHRRNVGERGAAVVAFVPFQLPPGANGRLQRDRRSPPVRAHSVHVTSPRVGLPRPTVWGPAQRLALVAAKTPRQ